MISFRFFLLMLCFSCSSAQPLLAYSTTPCYHSITKIEKMPPVEKNKKKKKSRKKKIRKSKKFYQSPDKTTEIGAVLGTIGLILLLLLPIAFLVIGGVLGLVGWVIAGTTIMGLWILLGYIFVLTRYSIIPLLGLIIFALGLLIGIGFLIWGLAASIASIVIASIILGVLALGGIALLFALS